MRFVQDPLESRYRIEQVDTPNGRFYTLDGADPLPSVTTVIGRQSDGSWLEKWRARVGEVEAEGVRRQAGVRGDAVHRIAQKYLLGEDHLSGEMPANVLTFKQIQSFFDEHVTRVRAIELPLYSRLLRTAGRTDALVDIEGVTAIIDVKTSRRMKESVPGYEVQGGCYGMMVNELYPELRVRAVAVVMAVDDSPRPKIILRRLEDLRDKVEGVFVRGEPV